MNSLIAEQATLFVPAPNTQKHAQFLDRVAMRVGLWLVVWGTRVEHRDPDRLANDEHRARERRELGYRQRMELHRPF